MKKLSQMSFAQKLMLYLLVAFIPLFLVLFITFSLYSTNIIEKVSLYHTQTSVNDVIYALENRINEIENISDVILSSVNTTNIINPDNLLEKVFTLHPYIDECIIYLDSSQVKCHNHSYLYGAHIGIDSALVSFPVSLSSFFTNNSILKYASDDGHWALSSSENLSPKILFYKSLVKDGQKYGLITLKFYSDKFLSYLNNIKLTDAKHIFIADTEGNLVTHNHPSIPPYQNIFNSFWNQSYKIPQKKKELSENTAGYLKAKRKENKSYLLYSYFPKMNWFVGMEYPKEKMIGFSKNYYLFFFSLLGISAVLLIWAIQKVVQKLSQPLKIFIDQANYMTEGKTGNHLLSIHRKTNIHELNKVLTDIQKSINNYRELLHHSTTENEKINSEIKQAQKLQNSFLQQSTELPSNIELFWYLKQSKKVGGDLYDYFVVENNLYFTIGDVSGKGIPAALYMASIIKLFRHIASAESSTARICTLINKYMSTDTDDELYITMFIGILNLQSGKITYTNAGHLNPVILHKNGYINYLDYYSDIPIGIVEDYTFKQDTYLLPENSQIILYTDGITDSENRKNDFFGEKRLIEYIKDSAGKNPKEVIEYIIQQLNEYVKDHPQTDDYTILSILRKPLFNS